MDHWWESINKACSCILSLSSILHSPSSSSSSYSSSSSISSLADSDDPAHSLLTSVEVYFAILSALSSPLSGSSDPLCRWLYDTCFSSVPDLHLFCLSLLPLVSNLYLTQSITASTSLPRHHLAGFQSILFALYNSQIQSHNNESLPILIPDLSKPSIYHNPFDKPNPNKGHYPRHILPKKDSKRNFSSNKSGQSTPSLQATSAPFEPQIMMKATEPAFLVGFALDNYYKEIAKMPRWSKIEFCKVVAAWAGPCNYSKSKSNDNVGGIENIVKETRKKEIEEDHGRLEIENSTRILLPWELLQPALRILGHCLLGPFCTQDIKDAALVAVKRLYARSTHDLDPGAILATKNLLQLANRA